MNSFLPYLTLANLAQIGIAIFGVTAVACSQSKSFSVRKWASVLGLAGQPFWIYAAWHAEQWGILALCALYTASWAHGLYTHWIAVDKWTDAALLEHARQIVIEDGSGCLTTPSPQPLRHATPISCHQSGTRQHIPTPATCAQSLASSHTASPHESRACSLRPATPKAWQPLIEKDPAAGPFYWLEFQYLLCKRLRNSFSNGALAVAWSSSPKR